MTDKPRWSQPNTDGVHVELTRDPLFAHMCLAYEAMRWVPKGQQYAVPRAYWDSNEARPRWTKGRMRRLFHLLITVPRRRLHRLLSNVVDRTGGVRLDRWLERREDRLEWWEQ